MRLDRTLFIFECCEFGLANRVRAYVGVRALGTILRVPVYMYWQRNEACDAAPSDLFEAPALNLVTRAEAEDLARQDGAVVVRSTSWFDRIWREYGKGWVTWNSFAAAVGDTIRSLRPAPKIADAVGNHATKWPLSASVGFHIRHTDNLQWYQHWTTVRPTRFRPDFVSTLAGFTSEIDTTCGKEPCFVATDNQEIEDALRHRYGNAISILRKKYLTNNSPSAIRTTSVETALCEMILLARCRRIIGTYYSSFSKFSAVWGGAEYFEIRGNRTVKNLGLERLQFEVGTLRERPALMRRLAMSLRPRSYV